MKDAPKRAGRTRVGTRGFSLFEILIVLAIMGILFASVVISFQGWMLKHRVVAETSEIFADIINARAKAMQRGRATFVVLSGNGCSTYEDTSPAPDGNMTLDTGADTHIMSKTPIYPVQWNLVLTGTSTPVSQFRFNRDGFASASGSIHLHSTTTPDVDCISIGPTRVKLGRYDDATNICTEQ